eukprot:971-Heterococcus_DN1.PRE.2
MADRVLAVIANFWECRLVHCFAELGIADVMATEAMPMSSGKICERLGLPGNIKSEPLMYRMLRCLSSSSSKLVEESDNLDEFTLTDSGRALQSNALRNNVLLELSSTHRAAWEKLEDLIREGQQNAFPKVFGAPLFEYLSQTDAAAQAHNRIFNNAMSANTATESERVALLCSELFSTKPVCHVVDVAGGRGVLAKAVLAATSAARATVTDIASVVKDCTADVPNLKFKSPCTSMIAVIAYMQSHDMHERWLMQCALPSYSVTDVLDMFKHAEPGADLYTMKHILHDWDDAQCSTLLQHVKNAAAPGATLLVCEYVVGAAGATPFAKAFDCHMMVVTDGRERTFAEYTELLKAAGYERITLHEGHNGAISVVEARVPSA